MKLSVFLFLVIVAVAGRLGQPQWCFTPLAAATLFAGFYFRHAATAVLVPISALLVSDLALAAHDSFAVMLAVYLAMLLPVIMGRDMRRYPNWPRLGLYSILPAIGFWLITNFAVWAFQDFYPHTAGGLITCYTSAIPFLRAMLMGDLLYVAIIFGVYAIAGNWAGRLMEQPS
jgi:hypothetical protein